MADQPDLAVANSEFIARQRPDDARGRRVAGSTRLMGVATLRRAPPVSAHCFTRLCSCGQQPWQPDLLGQNTALGAAPDVDVRLPSRVDSAKKHPNWRRWLSEP